MLRGAALGPRHGGAHFAPRRWRPSGSRRATIVVLAKKKKPEYGSGRTRLPGLADMPGLAGSGLEGPRNTGSGNSSSRGSSEPQGPTLANYLEFGRLMGEKPRQVQQQLEVSGMEVRVDQESAQYLQSWEREELEAYALFEGAVTSLNARPVGNSASAKKLQRNKNQLSAVATAEQLRAQARRQAEEAAAMTASQRRLAKNKRGQLGALSQLIAAASKEDAGAGSYELVVSKPSRASEAPAARLATKPTRPADIQGQDEYALDEDQDFDFAAAWEEAEAFEEAEVAAAAEGKQLTYADFEALLGSGGPASRGKAAKPKKPSSAAPAAPSGRVSIKLRQAPAAPARPTLVAKPQASAAAREAAQRPLPPPEPTLAAKPAKPVVSDVAPPQPPAAPAKPAPVPRAPPQLAAKPAAKPSLEAAPQAAVKPAVQPATAFAQPPEEAAKPPPPSAQQPKAATKPAPPPARPARAAADAEQLTKPAAPKPTPTPEQKQQQQEATLVKPAVTAAELEVAPTAPEVAAPTPEPAVAELPIAAAVTKTQGAQQAPQQQAEQAAAPQPAQRPVLQKPAAPPQQPAQRQQRSAEQPQPERRARNLAYGAQCLIDRTVERLTVWQANAAGVLVRNERLSGFVPLSQLSPTTVREVMKQEQLLLATVSSAGAAAQQEAGQQQPQQQEEEAASAPELDQITRSAFRRQALAAVMMGRQLEARVVNVDEQSGRVVLSEKAAVDARQPAERRPPTPQQLQTAATLLGQAVDATVVVVKPFGCFVEFEVPAPTGSTGQQGAAGAAPESRVVGLVHRSEVSWDPSAEVEEAVQVGQQVRARVVHVDAAKARIFLSIRKSKPNPLLETLDSLVTASAAAAAAGGSGAAGGNGGGASEAGLDQRPLLGDLPEAVRFCEVLRGSPGVLSAELGVRLKSRAASQELEVYMATKDAASSIGAAVAAVDGTAVSPSAGGVSSPDAHTYNLVLRKEQSVQEVSVVATMSRDEVRELAAAGVLAVATETVTV